MAGGTREDSPIALLWTGIPHGLQTVDTLPLRLMGGLETGELGVETWKST